MAKGPPPKPTAMRILNGTTQPCRMNPDEPEIEVLRQMPTPPKKYTDEERKIWAEFLASVPAYVCTTAETPLLKTIARLYVKSETDCISDSGLNVLLRGLGQLGMTPAERTRIVSLKPKKGGNRFEGL